MADRNERKDTPTGLYKLEDEFDLSLSFSLLSHLTDCRSLESLMNKRWNARQQLTCSVTFRVPSTCPFLLSLNCTGIWRFCVSKCHCFSFSSLSLDMPSLEYHWSNLQKLFFLRLEHFFIHSLNSTKSLIRDGDTCRSFCFSLHWVTHVFFFILPPLVTLTVVQFHWSFTRQHYNSLSTRETWIGTTERKTAYISITLGAAPWNTLQSIWFD